MCPGVGWLDHMVTQFFSNFLRNLQTVFCGGCTSLLSSPRVHKGSLFFTSLPVLAISYLFDKRLSDLSKPVMRDVTTVLTCILLMTGDELTDYIDLRRKTLKRKEKRGKTLLHARF